MINSGNKKIFLIAAGLFVLGLLVYPLPPKGKRLVLTIDYGNGQRRSFELRTEEQKKVWSALQEVAAVAELELEAGNNFYPKKIDSRPNGVNNKKWNFYVNGVKQWSSPINTVVKPPAEILFKFE
jgi:hypothetical protein